MRYKEISIKDPIAGTQPRTLQIATSALVISGTVITIANGLVVWWKCLGGKKWYTAKKEKKEEAKKEKEEAEISAFAVW